MEKKTTILCSFSDHKQWLVIPISLLSTSIFLLLIYTSLTSNRPPIEPTNTNTKKLNCTGRYIYIQVPPSQFNRDLLVHCDKITAGTDHNMCPYLANGGIGERLEDPERVLLNGSWYRTNQFALAVIFHNRMQRYECLTNDSLLASAIYVPYYAGLDVSRYLWSKNISQRDELALEFVKWLSQTPEWERMSGRDHFLVSGRISGDFRRESDQEPSNWGSRLRLLPESKNMSMLAVESTIWKNDYAIPYPTCFHPSEDSQIVHWQKKMRRRKRQYLFSFAGAPRPNNPETLRAKVIEECRGSNNSCKLLDCDYGPNGAIICDNPVKVIRLFRNSVFCLQPRGDSCTRRSFFDSILSGCIPVLFHPCSAYVQYEWHLPKNYSKYSVYIPVENEGSWISGKVKDMLLKISEDRVKAMRDEVIGLIPKLVYADPRSKLETLEDAFDIAVNGILERVEKVRMEINEGKDPSIGFDEKDVFKFDFSRYAGGN